MENNKTRYESLITAVQPGEDLSNANKFSYKSDNSEVVYRQYGQLKPVTQHDCRGVVGAIVNEIFDRKVGIASISKKQRCVSEEFKDSEDMDKRLKQWQDTLRDRVKMQNKITRKTGRRPEEMLFNLPATVEQRDKGTVQRLMDYASRLNPVKLQQKVAGVLPELHNECICMQEIQETLPQAEQDKRTAVEISGLTQATRQEILCSKNELISQKSREATKWLNSKVLNERIENEAVDIGRVLEFYPDVDNLQIIGANPLNPPSNEHNEEITLMVKKSMHSISSTTIRSSYQEQKLESVKNEKVQQLAVKMEPFNVGLKINNQTCIADIYSCCSNIDLQCNLECAPYEIQVKQVLRLENIGRKIIVCEWQVLECAKCHDEFLFDNRKIKLFPGDVHITRALFQPREICVRRQHLELRIFPNIFGTCRNSLLLTLHGKCVSHPEYLNKLNKNLQIIVNKSNEQATKYLAAHHAELAPLIQPHERLCPYERVFDERELFNAKNPGYHCDRFDDLETLKILYNILKTPREPEWDLRLATIKELIMRLSDMEKREIFFRMYIDVQEPLCYKYTAGIVHFEHNYERDRSRFIYVRGCIGNGIEEWENLMLSLEQNCLKSELTRFYARLAEEAKKTGDYSSENEDTKPWLQQLKYDQPELYVLRKLRAKKHYRDSLYMRTYTQLCDIAENIVSVIESTEHI
ncbi:uncharacterized protein LOC6559579 [Drosophila grimshawi]|uniref:GH21523 n=1 Tax=Drosophila grimshawi TaxID=7222 RepID=B4J404_DROGR|nr:uncharacterized protein LOC6559579 [Drosophila grimshawi]EDW01587.1 GH21523 [Drosophila grimshawi]